MICPNCKCEQCLLGNRRTSQQNRALHLYFNQLAEALNDAGYDMKKTIRNELDIPWTGATVKEYLWRSIQKMYLKKQSTANLTRKEIDTVYDVVNREIANRTGVSVPFPNLEAYETYTKENEGRISE